MRPRVGFRPTRPQKDAGLRIEPPPPPPLASGTMPAATAAAVPPLEPAVERDGSQGLRVAPVWRDHREGGETELRAGGAAEIDQADLAEADHQFAVARGREACGELRAHLGLHAGLDRE